MQQQRAAWGLAVSVAVLGINWPVMKFGLQYVDPFWMVALRLLAGAALAFALLAMLGRTLAPPAPGDRAMTLAVGVLQMFGMVGLTTVAMQWIPASLTTALTYTTPLWVTLIEAARRRALPSAWSLLSLLLGVSGLGLVLWGNLHVAVSASGPWPGVACALLAAVGWSWAIVLSGRHRWQAQPLEVLPWTLLVGGLPMAALAMGLSGPPAPSTWSLPGLAAMAYVGPIATVLGMWGMSEASWRLPSTLVASVTALTPVVGIAASALWLDEALTPGLLLGSTLVIASALLRVRVIARGQF